MYKAFTRIVSLLIMTAMEKLPKPHIRPMTEDDLDAVMEIENASYSLPWKRNHFQNEIEARYSLPVVVVESNRVIGYACLMSLFEEAQILDIAVAPEQRGRGIAQLLMGYAITVSRQEGAEVMALEVRASNSAAIALYEKLGFKRTGVRAKYYEGVDDALLMEKQLKENQ
jgi:ribosomal-protein-alanine N-acetyltransferase